MTSSSILLDGRLCSVGEWMVIGFSDCVTFASTFKVSGETRLSLLALGVLMSVFTLDVDDLPASRREEPSEERRNLHRFDGVYFLSVLKLRL